MVYMTDGYEPAPATPEGGVSAGVGSRIGLVVQILGAVTSLALLAGVVVWGYQLVVRDASGIPVVRAMAGPMREAPNNPGGELALHTGLAVNAVAAMGEAAPPEDRLTLAPSMADLTAEDLQVVPTAPGPERDVAEVDMPPAAAEIVTRASSDTPLSAQDILALADAISAGSVPLSDLAAEPVIPANLDTADSEPLDDTTDEVTAILASLTLPQQGDGLSRTLRPQLRPDSVVTLAAASPVSDTYAVSTQPLPVGTTLVQLGAFESIELAGAEWGSLAERFDDFMSGKERLIQQAESGGQPFFRLRATGFEDMADARRFCSALLAEDADCIPVVVQ